MGRCNMRYCLFLLVWSVTVCNRLALILPKPPFKAFNSPRLGGEGKVSFREREKETVGQTEKRITPNSCPCDMYKSSCFLSQPKLVLTNSNVNNSGCVFPRLTFSFFLQQCDPSGKLSVKPSPQPLPSSRARQPV